MKLTDVCIEKPVFAWMLMAATVVFGVVAATAHRHQPVPRRRLPDHLGRSDVGGRGAGGHRERRRRDPRGGGRSRSRASARSRPRRGRAGASITVELDLSRDVDLALQDVQAKVAQAQQRLPRDIDPPVISKIEPRGPADHVGRPLRAVSRSVLADYARYRVKEKLQTVPGVGEITLGGYLERNVRIWVDAARLDERGLTVTDVIAALQREHVELPAGQARGRRARGQRARARRGARPRRRCGGSSSARCGQPGLPRGRRARRGRLRGHPPRVARQRRAGAGPRRPQAARRERRRGRRGVQARRSPRSRRPCPRA